MTELPPVRRCVSALLLTSENKLVIQLRDDKPGLPFPAHWATLGGAIEHGESPDEAMRRELLEEIAPAPPVTFWRFVEHHFALNGKQHTVENYVYVGQLPCAIEDIQLFEGQQLAAFNSAEIKQIPIAYGLETVLAAFFDEYQTMSR
ncbi:MAG: NUDIX domain-containing protein [Anaerolineae bacterium]